MSNKVDIQDVMLAVKENSPLSTVCPVTWEYPGYIHVAFPSSPGAEFYIALGTSLTEDSGYSWNDTEGNFGGLIEDFDSAESVALTFWGQVIKELEL